MKQTNQHRQQQQQQQSPNQSARKAWGDTNGDGRFDIDDVLIAIRSGFQWVFSWRGAMALFGMGLVGAAGLNIAAWVSALSPLKELAPMAGFIAWGAIQAFELLPIMDDLSLDASLGAMVRRQRKPLEMPVINETLNPDAHHLRRRYKRREASQQITAEFARYALYGLELAVLVLAGNLVNYVGINWANILIAIVGMVGVEVCLRMFNFCADRLLTRDERDFLAKLKSTAKHTSVSLD
jgi:hypothetical protein